MLCHVVLLQIPGASMLASSCHELSCDDLCLSHTEISTCDAVSNSSKAAHVCLVVVCAHQALSLCTSQHTVVCLTAKRPLNSALELDLDFERQIRPPPQPTEEATASLEDLIK